MAVGAEKRNVCFVGISICFAIQNSTFQNSCFLFGSSGLAEARHYLLALRIEFNQRKASLITISISTLWLSYWLVSSGKGRCLFETQRGRRPAPRLFGAQQQDRHAEAVLDLEGGGAEHQVGHELVAVRAHRDQVATFPLDPL